MDFLKYIATIGFDFLITETRGRARVLAREQQLGHHLAQAVAGWWWIDEQM